MFRRSIQLTVRFWLALGSGLMALTATEMKPAVSEEQRFHVRVYTTDGGLPQTRVACLAQTPDGYLWCGTWFGLARFDGVRFVTFDRYNTPAFAASDAIQQLIVDTQGTLWVGTAKALHRQTESGFVEVPLPGGWGGHGVSGLCAQPSGGVLAVGEFVLVRTDGTNTMIASLPKGIGIPRVMASSNGIPLILRPLFAVWWRDRAANNWRQIAMPSERYLSAGLIGPASNGVWSYCAEGLLLFSEDGQAHWQPLPEPLAATGIQNAAPARDGGLWLADVAGRLWHWRAGTAEALHVDAGANFSRGVAALFEDREANLWVAGYEGLVRLRRRVIRSFTTRDGLPADETWSVCPARSGGVWVGGKNGTVCRVEDEVVENLPPLVQIGIPNPTIQCVLEESQGRLLVQASGGLGMFQFVNGAWKSWPDTAPYGNVLYEDRHARLWVGGDGAAWHAGTSWHRWSRTNSLPGAGVHVIHQSQDGAMWFGTRRGGLARLEEQTGEIRVFGSTEGLASDEVWAIHESADGALWIGGSRGLARLSLKAKAPVFSFTPERGLSDDAVNWILEDGNGYLWLSGLRGIHRVSRPELEAVARGQRSTASCATYGVDDGMEDAESNGEHAPAGCVDAAGRLWFPTGKGVVRIDPKLVNVDAPPPAVVLQEVRIDRENFPAAANPNREAGRLKLAPGRAQLVQFRYTAPTFISAERARFRHRLRGLNDAWHEAGEERVAYFTNLKPGDYKFEVTAANAHGVWAEAPAVFAFSLTPHLWQAWPFYGLCVLATFGLVAGLTTRRLRVVRRMLRLDHERALEQERARIARDLHDDLGASLTGVALQLEAAQRQGRADGEQLATLAGETRSLAHELRELAWTTNPRCDNASSLVAFIGEQTERFCEAAELECRLSLPSAEARRTVPARVRHELLVVLKESFTNVAAHAGARSVAVTMTVDAGEVRLVVRDDGRGFDPARATAGSGLRNLRERLQQLGGTFAVDTERGRGTTVEARLPLNNSNHS